MKTGDGYFLPYNFSHDVFSAQLAECFGRKNRPMLKMNKKKVFYINIKLGFTNAKRFVPAAEIYVKKGFEYKGQSHFSI